MWYAPRYPLSPETTERLNRAMRAEARAQATLDEAITVVVLRGRLPRGLKWLVGFPRVLGAYGRLRGWS